MDFWWRENPLNPCDTEVLTMAELINGFPSDGVVTVNRVLLKPEYTVDDLQ